jgi:hypothetical protein
MQNATAMRRANFTSSVPVFDGFIVHHGKKLSPPSTMLFSEKQSEYPDLCLHNGQPITSGQTAYFMEPLSFEDAAICTEFCGFHCANFA